MSRDLDKWVAEVLGWTGFSETPTRGLMGDANRVSNAKKWKVPLYSTDIAAAIGALEEYCKDGRRFDVGRCEPKPDGVGGYYCTIATHVLCPAHGNGATIPLAICNAILSASDAGVGE